MTDFQVFNMFQNARGTRDTMPEEMIRFQYVIDVIKRIYEKYGFDPLDTPVFEEWGLLSAKQGGGEEIKQEIYYFKDKSERELGLRFDLTVPLARVFVNNPQLPLPFKRYQIAKVWRYDKPGANRWREFWQADIDVVGSESIEAEAECLKAICEIFYELGFSDFSIRINNRKTVEAFVKSVDVKDYVDVFRSVDKMDKIGEDGVRKELEGKGVEEDKIKKILEFIKIRNIEDARKFVSEGLDELETITSLLKDYGKNISVDMSLVRGLEYYTGPVFEVTLGEGLPSVGGGGRYDNLTESVGGKKIPATGISLGVDRIVSVMGERGMFNFGKTVCNVFVIAVNEKVKSSVIDVTEKIRKNGIAAEFDLMNRSLSKQLDYASSRGIPYVIVIGDKELQSGKAKVRDMKTGEEKDISLNELEEIKKIVG